MNIVIRNYLSGSFLLEKEPQKWDALVVLDPDLEPTDFVPAQSLAYRFLFFDDVVNDRLGKIPPESEDVSSALEFAKQSENLLVCCRAGQSRSAALAYLVSCLAGEPKEAVKIWNPKRHSPNSLIIELGAELLGRPEIWSSYSKWKQLHRGTKLTDFLDEISWEFDELEAQGARNLIA